MQEHFLHFYNTILRHDNLYQYNRMEKNSRSALFYKKYHAPNHFLMIVEHLYWLVC